MRLKASRKNGFVSTVSARALNVAARNSFTGFGHHQGTRPQRIRTRSRLPSRSVTRSIGSVGHYGSMTGGRAQESARLCINLITVSKEPLVLVGILRPGKGHKPYQGNGAIRVSLGTIFSITVSCCGALAGPSGMTSRAPTLSCSISGLAGRGPASRLGSAERRKIETALGAAHTAADQAADGAVAARRRCTARQPDQEHQPNLDGPAPARRPTPPARSLSQPFRRPLAFGLFVSAVTAHGRLCHPSPGDPHRWLRLKPAKRRRPAMLKTLLVALAIVCLTNGLLTSTGRSSTPKPTVASVIVACHHSGC